MHSWKYCSRCPKYLDFNTSKTITRSIYGGVDLRARRSANEELHDLAINNADHQHQHGPQLHKDNEHGHGGEDGEHGHGYQVFHVEFDRVELPFIIALWIFVSSLAKIGKPKHYLARRMTN